jgi:hypothetical protein
LCLVALERLYLYWEKIEKNCFFGFFYFLNFALKHTFPTSPHTCIQTNEWKSNLQKSIQIFEKAIFKNYLKKSSSGNHKRFRPNIHHMLLFNGNFFKIFKKIAFWVIPLQVIETKNLFDKKVLLLGFFILFYFILFCSIYNLSNAPKLKFLQ